MSGINGRNTAKDIEAVITSYNQGSMVLEAVQSLCSQTVLPAGIFIVDDGSSDGQSVRILSGIETDSSIPVPVTVVRQSNSGVSAARNAGIRMSKAPMVLVLDGDDRLKPAYIEQASQLLRDHPSMVAASSWMQAFGVLDAQIRPGGGRLVSFLARNCCPAAHILRREAWEQCGGYDESMRYGFEDWEFFLSILETAEDAVIGMVEQPLIEYRTAPASANVSSMAKRTELLRYIIEKHSKAYHSHTADVILEMEAIASARLSGWESEIIHSVQEGHSLSESSAEFLAHPSYGDGGMAAAVRVMYKSNKKALKILLFDLDGTLLRNDKTISEYTLEILSKCKGCGYLIGISTSRSEQNCLGFLRELKPDILISSGGALVRVNEKIICSSSFSVIETKSFIESVRKICGMDCEITVDTIDAHYWNYKTNPKEQDKSWGESIYTDFTDFKYEALKICVEIPHLSLAQKLCEHFSELDSQRFSDGNWYKFTKSGITKEKAILAVCEACHVAVSETVAFGDDYADIGMLKLCGIGVAMGNAVQEVKDIADDITLSNEEDGVAAYLEKSLFAEGYYAYKKRRTKGL